MSVDEAGDEEQLETRLLCHDVPFTLVPMHSSLDAMTCLSAVDSCTNSELDSRVLEAYIPLPLPVSIPFDAI